MLQLFFKLGLVVGFRPKRKRMAPLEMRVELAPDLPIGVAQMGIDGGIARHQQYGILESLGRIGITPKPLISPADAVDDVTVEGAQRAGFFQHRERLREIAALVDPAIAEIVQDLRLIGAQLERVL